LVAEAVHGVNGGEPWANLSDEKRRKKESKAKRTLNDAAAARMTVARLAQTDPNDEIRGWLTSIAQMIATANA
jgi:putative ATP-dependent endonuclease of OLD family